MPSTPGLTGAARRTASSAARILSGVSVISVGSSPVVPNLRCAGDDRGDALRRRFVVEQNVAAAIDLHVDEAGCEPRALRQRPRRHPRRHVAARDDGGDTGAVDHHRAIAMHRLAVEDGAGHHRVGARAHSVRVIFCRWRG